MTNKLHHYTSKKGNDLWDCISEDLPANAEKKSLKDKDRFDYYIKQSFETQHRPFLGKAGLNLLKQEYGFYLPGSKRFYDRYFSKEMKLEELLSDDIRECYEPKRTKKTTSGNEFKSGKFYSVASSSRLAVSSFTKERDGKLDYIKRINGEEINEAKFEYDAPITGIPKERHCPQLDFFFKTNNGTYFIEVKCHEILDNHKPIELSPSYMKTDAFKKLKIIGEPYERTYKDSEGKIHHYISLSKDGDKKQLLSASDFDCELKTYHFDFEQFLRHLMGIYSYAEEHKEEEIYFYYLIYRNELYEQETKSKLYEELETEVKAVFKVFGKKFTKIHFGLCYNNKYDTLKELHLEDFA